MSSHRKQNLDLDMTYLLLFTSNKQYETPLNNNSKLEKLDNSI
ncbi:hypothetical protein VIA_000032 [Vibrio orientalis CIP 102891 = ATCC 33934]|uniref:Uncharacterized protein n=1 Tax=Vibrio orientalis CIP 102891 = ATCC 33934 TaxID=675816 RepID=A0ABP2H6U6_VIBOR|nr:hypothetical protein VIA_000032 [Vibrio orientalis CIP 102891 = ATCC 33934]